MMKQLGSSGAGMSPTNYKEKVRGECSYSKYEPPDGGWAWFIVLGAFINTAITMGTLKSAGIFFVEFLTVFDTSLSQLGWINGIAMVMIFGLAPITSNLGKLIGYRKQFIIGGIISSAGYILAAFSTNVTHLYLTMGLIAGIGYSVSWVPSIALVGLYFDKRKSVANGIAASGAGIGSFILPPLISYLLSVYGYKGAVLIIGGLSLNMCITGFLHRPLKSFAKKIEVENEELNQVPAILVTQCAASERKEEGVEDGESEIACMKRAKQMSLSVEDIFIETVNIDTETELRSTTTDLSKNRLKLWVARFRDVFWKSIWNKEIITNRVFIILAICVILVMYGYFLVHVMIPVRCSELGMVAEDGALLVSILSVVELVSRLIEGWLYDQPFITDRVDKCRAFGLALLLGGIASILSMQAVTFTGLAVYAVCFGVLMSNFGILLLTLMVELLGRHHVTSTWGLLLVVRTIPGLTGNPLVGYLRDSTGNSEASFYFMGAVLVFAGILALIFLPSTKQRRSEAEI